MTPDQIIQLRQITDAIQAQNDLLIKLSGEVENPFLKQDLITNSETVSTVAASLKQTAKLAEEDATFDL